MLVLNMPEFIKASKNQRMCLVTLTLGDQDAFLHGRVPEQNEATSFLHDFFHPIHNHLSSSQELVPAYPVVAESEDFQGLGKKGDYWHKNRMVEWNGIVGLREHDCLVHY